MCRPSFSIPIPRLPPPRAQAELRKNQGKINETSAWILEYLTCKGTAGDELLQLASHPGLAAFLRNPTACGKILPASGNQQWHLSPQASTASRSIARRSIACRSSG